MSRGSFKLILLALLTLAAIDVVLSRGKAVPPGSYVDDRGGFSLVPPEGWHALAAERFREAADINPALAASLADRQLALVLIGPGTVGQGASSVQVAVVPGDSPGLSERDPQALARPIEAEIEKTFGPFTRDSARRRNVDGLAALELSGLLETRAGGRQFRVRLIQVLVPGDRRHYLLTFLGSPARESSDVPAFQAVL